MKQLASFIVLNVNGGDRISFTYDTIDDKTGTPTESNIKETFFAVDNELRNHIEGIRNFIRENKLAEE